MNIWTGGIGISEGQSASSGSWLSLLLYPEAEKGGGKVRSLCWMCAVSTELQVELAVGLINIEWAKVCACVIMEQVFMFSSWMLSSTPVQLQIAVPEVH